MPTQRYALEPNGAPRLEVSWKWNFKDVVVKLDGIEVGRIATPAELKLGREFALVDGSTLRVQLNSQLHTKELMLTRNGAPLPGSSTHPETVVKTAAGLLGVIAAFTAAISIFRMWSGAEMAEEVGTLVEAAIYGLLAWRVMNRSLIALWIAILLYFADTVFSLMEVVETGKGSGAHGIVWRVIVFIALARAISAIRELRASAAPTPPPVPA
jgi:hypothetical protein